MRFVLSAITAKLLQHSWCDSEDEQHGYAGCHATNAQVKAVICDTTQSTRLRMCLLMSHGSK